MSRTLAFLALLLLSACGFSPMYGSAATGKDGVSAKAGLDNVDIALIPDQEGVYLRNILIDHFYQGGYPSSPAYLLTVEKIQEQESDLDITIESEATRKQIRLYANIRLVDKKDGKEVMMRRLTSLTSYNVLGSQFTTRVSKSDAREAALTDLARQIENQVALYFKR